MRIIPIDNSTANKLKDIIAIEACASDDNAIRILISEYEETRKRKEMMKNANKGSAE